MFRKRCLDSRKRPGRSGCTCVRAWLYAVTSGSDLRYPVCRDGSRTDLGVYRNVARSDTVNLMYSHSLIEKTEGVKARRLKEGAFYCDTGKVRSSKATES